MFPLPEAESEIFSTWIRSLSISFIAILNTEERTVNTYCREGISTKRSFLNRHRC